MGSGLPSCGQEHAGQESHGHQEPGQVHLHHQLPRCHTEALAGVPTTRVHRLRQARQHTPPLAACQKNYRFSVVLLIKVVLKGKL